MISYLDKIRFLHPTIQRVMQVHRDNDGNYLGYDGVVWENEEILKPTKEELDAIPDEQVVAFLKKEEKDNRIKALFSDDSNVAVYLMMKAQDPTLTKTKFLNMIDKFKEDFKDG